MKDKVALSSQPTMRVQSTHNIAERPASHMNESIEGSLSLKNKSNADLPESEYLIDDQSQ